MSKLSTAWWKSKKSKAPKPYKDLWGGYSYDWKGGGTTTSYSYYYEPPLSAKYVEQLVLGIGNQFGVTVEAGENWGIDLEKKKLEYNPRALARSTKAEILCSILHECGHIRYTTPYTKLTPSEYYPKYQSAKIVINAFEDFRVDELMAHAYDGADDIYMLNREAMEREAANFDAQGEEMRQNAKSLIRQLRQAGEDKEAQELEDKLYKPTLYDYLGAIMRKGSGIVTKWVKPEVKPEIVALLAKTEGAIEKCKVAKNTDEVHAILATDVFPYIKDLLEDANEDEKNNGRGKGRGKEQLVRAIGRKITPHAGKLREGIPPDWPGLEAMVKTETRQLTEALKKITVTDQAMRFAPMQRSGTVQVKRLYRARLGDVRIFEKKQQEQVRTKELAFTLMIDRSGSMCAEDGNDDTGMSYHRATQAGKVTAMIAAASEKVGIPYEIIAFDGAGHHIKKFAEAFTTERKAKAHNYIINVDGGNHIENGIEKSELPHSPKSKKVMFLITDGGEREPEKTARWIKKYEAEKGVRMVFLGIGTDAANNPEYQYIKEPYGKMFNGNTNEMPEWIAKVVQNIAKGTL